MYNQHIKNCIETFKIIPSKKDLEPSIKQFLKARRVIFCTMGKSAFACRKIVYTARSYGLDWHDLDVCHAFHGDAGLIRAGDLLVFVSKSGETKETIKVARYFSKHTSISMTSNPYSTLADMCNYSIDISIKTEGSPFGYAPMISTMVYMAVLHGILGEVITSLNITLEEYAKNHPEGNIGKLIGDINESKK
ncbi:SIS domain-containing protein [bacterium]|nr:SIS domain-containing protein [bacterium]